MSAANCGGGAATRVAAVYPIRTSSNNRYVVDQNNVPFLIAGDSPQALIGNISTADADLYFANRAGLGFNSVWINLLCTTHTFCNADGTTFEGIKPFLTGDDPDSYDLTTPNPTYFAKVDAVLNLAASHGLNVFLDPIETRGWLTGLKANGATKARAYGQFLGNRYKNFSNIVWLSGNDFFTYDTDPTANTDVYAVMQGIHDFDGHHLQTIELAGRPDGSLDDALTAPLVGLDGAYTYQPTYAQVLKNYNRTAFVPVFLQEANYEGGHNFPPVTGTPSVLRHQEYWAALSGATGQLYGDEIWTVRFAPGWQSHLNQPGAIQFGEMQKLMTSLTWWTLIPDQAHTFVTADYGVFDASDNADDTNNYVTAALASDGKAGAAYLPQGGSITVNMSKLSTITTVQWFDPTNGTFQSINGSPFANTGSQVFSSPGSNSAGDPDWVLVFKTTSATTNSVH